MPPANPNQRTPEKVAETVLAYYRQAHEFVATAEELATWLDALPASHRLHLPTHGIRQCLHLPLFMRYTLENRGYSLAAYMATHLTADEWAYWVATGDGDGPFS